MYCMTISSKYTCINNTDHLFTAGYMMKYSHYHIYIFSMIPVLTISRDIDIYVSAIRDLVNMVYVKNFSHNKGFIQVHVFITVNV